MSKIKKVPIGKKPRLPIQPRPPLTPEPLPFVKPRPRPPVKFGKLDDKLSLMKARAMSRVAGGSIVNEIIQEITQAVIAEGGTLSNDAFQEFRPALLRGIGSKLLSGGNWTTDGTNVLKAAKTMGKNAAGLAGGSTVAKAQIHASFYALKNGSTLCSNNVSGAGSWCDFFI